MTVDMRAYDKIVDKAVDEFGTHNEDERTEGELKALLSRMGEEVADDALKALGRYVNLSHHRHADSMRNLGL